MIAKDAGITKLRWIVNGGENGQASARNALRELKTVCGEEDIVVIHDAIRPMISGKSYPTVSRSADSMGPGLPLCGARRQSSVRRMG